MNSQDKTKSHFIARCIKFSAKQFFCNATIKNQLNQVVAIITNLEFVSFVECAHTERKKTNNTNSKATSFDHFTIFN